MNRLISRRRFLAAGVPLGAGLALGAPGLPKVLAAGGPKPLFKISVAEYSLHRLLGAGKLDPRDFGPFCKKMFDVDAVEHWMGPFSDKGRDATYIDAIHQRSRDAGVKDLLIMVDIPGGKGNLGNPDTKARREAVELHYPWVTAANRMGCHSIRVNARSAGSRDEQAKLAADGLRQLAEFAADHGINVLVENHGGLSSDGKWLSGVIKEVALPNCGTLPDFGNFYDYDRYQGVAELMPFARAVSAKSLGFDDQGNETTINYHRMLKIVVESGYDGYVGIEWEGTKPDEVTGTLLTKKLLERTRDELLAASEGASSD